MVVYYENKKYELELELRESLFPEYRDCYPDKFEKVKNESGTPKLVPLKDLKLEAEWRNL